jgi:uncharacterized membrane protein
MSQSEENKYRELAVFTTIVAEVVITPSALGGAAFWLLRRSSFQVVATCIAGAAGLAIAFYRIFLLRKRFES